jgi:pimeloyl-ACP methyl ester carboxylesterase
MTTVRANGLDLDAELVVIPGAGHVSNLDQPERFNEAVREFARTHSPRQV